uniref:Uncharacterized protein n=1 Tax=Anguilla anguilla TaxID=7936 RepID=A0A0E9TBR5_ANGAN
MPDLKDNICNFHFFSIVNMSNGNTQTEEVLCPTLSTSRHFLTTFSVQPGKAFISVVRSSR